MHFSGFLITGNLPRDELALVVATFLKITFPFWTAITAVVGGSFLAQYLASEAEPLKNFEFLLD